MTREIATRDSLEERLERVERDNRRLKRLGMLGILGAAGVFLLGLSAAPSKRVEAEVIVVKDSHGKARMILGAGDDGPAITLLDQNGKLRANLEVSGEGPALDLLDASEHPRAQLMITDDQGPLLNFYDAKGGQVSLKP
jgi:hypothetical protein